MSHSFNKNTNICLSFASPDFEQEVCQETIGVCQLVGFWSGGQTMNAVQSESKTQNVLKHDGTYWAEGG